MIRDVRGKCVRSKKVKDGDLEKGKKEKEKGRGD